jgi:hypothetical protein
MTRTLEKLYRPEAVCSSLAGCNRKMSSHGLA